MYDTQFFIKTYDIKRALMNGAYDGLVGDGGGSLESAPRGLGFESIEGLRHVLETAVSPRPRVFNIETTSHCNMRCVMCQRSTDLRRKPAHMRPEVFRALIDGIDPMDEAERAQWRGFLNDRGLRREGELTENTFYFDVLCHAVTLHGFGEPLLDPMLAERVGLFTDRGVTTYFSCNPCNIEPRALENVFAAGLGYVKFAMDGLSNDEARAIRGGKADFEVSRANVLRMLDLIESKSYDTTVIMTMLDFDGDPERRERFHELWRDTPALAFVKSVDNQWLLQSKNRADLASAQNKSHYKSQYCEYAFTSMTILENGDVAPCTQDVNGEWVMGNVKESSLEDIWNSPRYQRFRRMQITGRTPPGFMCREKCDLDIVADRLGSGEG